MGFRMKEEEEDRALLSSLGVISANPDKLENDIIEQARNQAEQSSEVGVSNESSSTSQTDALNRLRAINVEIEAVECTIEDVKNIPRTDERVQDNDDASEPSDGKKSILQASNDTTLKLALATDRLESLKRTKAQLEKQVGNLGIEPKVKQAKILQYLVKEESNHKRKQKEVPKPDKKLKLGDDGDFDAALNELNHKRKQKEVPKQNTKQKRHKTVAFSDDGDFDAVLNAASAGFVETERDELVRKGFLTPFHNLKGYERRIEESGPSNTAEEVKEVDDFNDFSSASISKAVQLMSEAAKARPTTKLLDPDSLPKLDPPTRPFRRLKTPFTNPFRLTDDGENGNTETSNLFGQLSQDVNIVASGASNQDMQGLNGATAVKTENLTTANKKSSKKKEKEKIDEGNDGEGAEETNILKSLFDAQGIHSAVNHDLIMNANDEEKEKLDSQASQIAHRAAEALLQSRMMRSREKNLSSPMAAKRMGDHETETNVKSSKRLRKETIDTTMKAKRKNDDKTEINGKCNKRLRKESADTKMTAKRKRGHKPETNVKNNKRLCKESTETTMIDRLTNLPESLQLRILSSLDFKQVVKTSVYRNHGFQVSTWFCIPVLNFSSFIFQNLCDFDKFVSKALSIHQLSRLDKLTFKRHGICNAKILKKVFDYAFSHHVNELEARISHARDVKGWPILSHTLSDSLTSLKLESFINMGCSLLGPRSGCFKNLTNLHLSRVYISDLDAFSGFPSLQRLKLIFCPLSTIGKTLNIHALQLSELTIFADYVNCLQLTTPKLRYFNYQGMNFPVIKTHKSSLAVLDTVIIDYWGVCYRKQEKIMLDELLILFDSFYNAKSLTVFSSIIHLLSLFPNNLANRCPPFRDLKYLNLNFSLFYSQNLFEGPRPTLVEALGVVREVKDYLLHNSPDAKCRVIYPND